MTLHPIHHNVFQASVSGQYAREKLGQKIFLLLTDWLLFGCLCTWTPSLGRDHREIATKTIDPRERTLVDWSYLSHCLFLESGSVRGIAWSKMASFNCFLGQCTAFSKKQWSMIWCVVISFSSASRTLWMTEFHKMYRVSLGPSFKFQDALPSCSTFLSLWGCEES